MSSKNNNKLNIPEARAAMDKFKMEAANEVGVNLKEGYNGHLTSREAGSVGGQMGGGEREGRGEGGEGSKEEKAGRGKEGE